MASKPSSTKTMWQPTIPVNQSIYEESTTQQAPLGTKLEVGDRVFYYARVSTSAAVSAGDVLCAAPLAASHQADLLTPIATSAGVKQFKVQMGGLAATANEYYEGYVMVSSGTGNGITYRIKTHSSIAASGTMTVNLYDELVQPMTATSELNFVPNMYNFVKVGSQALDMAVGVAAIGASTNSYIWLQTNGPAAPKHVAATPAAGVLHLGTTGGVVCTFDATTNGGIAGVAYQIGKNMSLAATAGENCPVFLTIRP